jgi:hypothetical protein
MFSLTVLKKALTNSLSSALPILRKASLDEAAQSALFVPSIEAPVEQYVRDHPCCRPFAEFLFRPSMISSISASFSWSALRADDKLDSSPSLSVDLDLLSSLPTIVISTSTSIHALSLDDIPSIPSDDDFASFADNTVSRDLFIIAEEDEEEADDSSAVATLRDIIEDEAATDFDTLVRFGQEQPVDLFHALLDIYASVHVPTIASIPATTRLPLDDDSELTSDAGDLSFFEDPEATLTETVSSNKLYNKLAETINSEGDISCLLDEIRAI